MEQIKFSLAFLFSFTGRIRRFQWWILQVIGSGTINFLIMQIIPLKYSSPTFIQTGVFMLGMVLAIWILLSSNAKRFHAFDKSGWNNLWLFVPLIGPFYVLYACGIKDENT